MIAAPAPAAAEELPAGKIGVMAGARQGLGALGGQFFLGPVWGVEAGWQPSSTDRRLSFGICWSLVWGYHTPDDASDNAASLSTREMSFGVKTRILGSPATPWFLALGGGLAILRTSVPVPPEEKRDYVGLYLAAGPEVYVLGRYLLNLEFRAGLLTGGPASLTLALGFSFGSG